MQSGVCGWPAFIYMWESPSLSPPSTTDEAWYWLKCVLGSGCLFIGTSLNEPHTSVTALRTCVSIYLSICLWTDHLPEILNLRNLQICMCTCALQIQIWFWKWLWSSHDLPQWQSFVMCMHSWGWCESIVVSFPSVASFIPTCICFHYWIYWVRERDCIWSAVKWTFTNNGVHNVLRQ